MVKKFFQLLWWQPIVMITLGAALFLLSVQVDVIAPRMPWRIVYLARDHGLQYYWIAGLLLSAFLTLGGASWAIKRSGQRIGWILVALLVGAYIWTFMVTANYARGFVPELLGPDEPCPGSFQPYYCESL